MTYNTEPFPFGPDMREYAGNSGYISPDGKFYVSKIAGLFGMWQHEEFAEQFIAEQGWEEEAKYSKTAKDFLCCEKNFIGFSFMSFGEICLTELNKITRLQCETLEKLYLANGFGYDKFKRDVAWRMTPSGQRFLAKED